MLKTKSYFLIKLSFFCACAAFASLFASCDNQITVTQTNEDYYFIDVEYSNNGRGITLYFDDDDRSSSSSSPAADRALSLSLAQFGHDYYEVVFLYRPVGGNGSDDIVARAAWEIGNSAGISGIHRTPAGVNYSMVGNGGISAGNGYAVLFVGRKEDKTLLAVGKLSHVDGEETTIIYSGTKSVTFTLDAFKTGVSDPVTADSLFLTSAGSGSGGTISAPYTVVSKLQVASRIYPVFKIQSASPGYPTRMLARYSFSTASSPSGANHFSDTYKYSVIVSSSNGGTEVIEPRYTIGSNVFVGTTLLHDQKTTVNITNNKTAGVFFENLINIEFLFPNTADGSVFSFVFHIPVHAITAAVDASGGEPTQWYIRPGFGTSLYDLDDGNDGSGGAILMGTGNVASYVDYRLVVTKPPNLSFTGASVFNLNGIEIKLLTAEGHLVKTILQNDSSLEVYINGVKTNNIPGSPSNRHVIIELRYSYNEKLYSDYLTAWVQ